MTKEQTEAKAKQDKEMTDAFMQALQDMSAGKSIIEAFLGTSSPVKKYIKSVSFSGTKKLKIGEQHV